MRNSSGSYPRVRVDGAGSGVVSQAGGVLLLETARTVGLDRTLTLALGRWRKPLAVHDPGKIALDLAVTLALGGDCLPIWRCCAPNLACTARSPPTRRCPG